MEQQPSPSKRKSRAAAILLAVAGLVVVAAATWGMYLIHVAALKQGVPASNPGTGEQYDYVIWYVSLIAVVVGLAIRAGLRYQAKREERAFAEKYDGARDAP